MTNAFDVFKDYVALKSHFTCESYDYQTYQGQTSAKVSSFEKRNDKYYFSKLAKKNNYHEILLANFVERNTAWIGELLEAESEELYNRWLKRVEALSYNFQSDLDKLKDDLKTNFKFDGQYPYVLKMFLHGKISIETIIILDELLHFLDGWDVKIKEKYIWPDVSLKIKKYRPFLNINRSRCKEIFLKRFA